MNESFANFHQSNPFSTRFTAPGKTPFFFEKSFVQYIKASRPAKFQELFSRALGLGEDVRNSICLRYLVDQFESHSRRGQIVGAHGTGKTSLMLAIRNELVQEGYEIFTWTLHDQTRFLPDVFWTEMQQFLQSVPVFLPTKCLLPPPVISQEEYLNQQRRSMMEIFGENAASQNFPSVDDSAKKSDIDEGFRISETDSDVAKEEPKDVPEAPEVVETPSAPEEAKGERKRNLEFGFNEAGNFGLRKTSDASGLFKELDAPIKFAPFRELDSVDDLDSENADANAEDEDDEEYDEVEIVDTDLEKEALGGAVREILSTNAKDFDRRRSLFEKKALFFDGFEQLSYVNRIIIRTFCRMNQLGLLLTTHKPAIGVPVLFRTIPSVEIVRELLKFLLEEVDMGDEDEMSDSEIETLLKNFHYDVREILFSMYDAYENFRLAPRDARERIIRRYPR